MSKTDKEAAGTSMPPSTDATATSTSTSAPQVSNTRDIEEDQPQRVQAAHSRGGSGHSMIPPQSIIPPHMALAYERYAKEHPDKLDVDAATRNVKRDEEIRGRRADAASASAAARGATSDINTSGSNTQK